MSGCIEHFYLATKIQQISSFQFMASIIYTYLFFCIFKKDLVMEKHCNLFIY